MKKWRLRTTLTITILFVAGLAFIIPAQATKVMNGKDFVAECKPSIEMVTVDEARTLHNSGEWVFLDVRTEKEFKKGAIPEAVHLQRGLLEFKVEKKIPNKTARIVVYCKSGSRSNLSVCTLKKMGYVNAVSLDGGWKGWVKDGHPVA
jgi:rhodanese-related sulfurtransferase